MSWLRRVAELRAGARDRAFSPAEAWLHRNGFPALVPGFGTPRILLRRPVATIGAALAWALAAYLIATVFIVIDVLVNSGIPLDLLDTDAGVQLALDATGVASTEWLIIVCCLLFGILVSGLGLGRIAFFSLTWFVRVARSSSGRLLTVLPLLLVAVMFFFLAAETWQSVGSLTPVPFTAANLLIAVLAIGFLIARARTDLTDLESFTDQDAVRQALPASPRANLFRLTPQRDWEIPAAVVPARDLRAIERFNVRSIVVLGKLIAAVLVALIVGAFFLLLGTIAVDQATATAWLGHAPASLIVFTLWGHEYAIFAETLRVSTFLASFSGLYFIVSATSDKEFARSLSEDTEQHLRSAFAVRAIALAERRMRRR